MATRTISNTGGNWNATGTWVEGAVPTAADEVVATATSGNLTINAAAACRSINLTNYVGTITHNSAITLSISFVSTSTTQQTVNSGGKILGNVTFNGVGGSWILSGNPLNTGATATVTVTNGTFDADSQGLSIGLFSSSNSNTRTINMGSVNWNLNGVGTIFNTATITGLTLNGGASTLILPTNTASSRTISTGGAAVNHIKVTAGTGTVTPTTVACNDLDFTGFSGVWGAASVTVTGNLTLSPTMTVTATASAVVLNNTGTTKTITTSGVTIPRPLSLSGSGGTVKLVGDWIIDAVTSSRAITLNKGTFDANGYNVTCTSFSAPNNGTRSLIMGTGTWTTKGTGTVWDTSVSTALTITPGNPLVIDNNSATGAAITTGTSPIAFKAINGTYLLTTGSGSFLDVDFTGFSGTLGSNSNTFFGNVTLSPTMTVIGGSTTWTFSATSSKTIATAGVMIDRHFTFDGVGGSWTLNGNLVIDSPTGTLKKTMTLTNGTFNANNFNVTVGQFSSSNSNTRTLTMGSGTWTFRGAGTIWDTSVTTGLTFNVGTSSLIVSSSNADPSFSPADRIFNGGGLTFNGLTYNDPNVPGTLFITGSNTFSGGLNIGSGRSLVMPSGQTNTVSSFSATGTNNGFWYSPGLAGSYVSSPDSPTLTISGDIDIRCKVAFPSWTPPVDSALVSKLNSSTNDRSFQLRLSTFGSLTLVISPDGVSTPTVATASGVGFANNAVKWVRATWRQSDGRVQFFSSDDGAAWTQVGTDLTLVSGPIFDSTTPIEVGSNNVGTGRNAQATFYRAQVRNNILDNGTGIIFDADFTTKPFGANSFTESSANAATVSITGLAAQAGDGRIAISASTPGSQAPLSKSSGTVACDYLTIQDSAAGGGATWNPGTHSLNLGDNSGWFFTSGGFFSFFEGY
jgi:hypothetical protein